MRVILSRKGFDSAAGGMPSPILPDGRLCSLPIPADAQGDRPADPQRYDEIIVQGTPLSQWLTELAPRRQHPIHAHHDPDLDPASRPRRPGWRPNLGQIGGAQRHLIDQGVGPGDLFLFFGWFRQTEHHQGALRWARGAPDQHIVFGYLQVESLQPLGLDDPLPDWAADHPHARPWRRARPNNALWVARERLTHRHLPGAGLFTNRDDRVLTAPGGGPRSLWQLPPCLRPCFISHHSPHSWRGDHFQSVARGQELVVHATEEAVDWAIRLIDPT